jgi:hypothetical protein
MYSKFRSSKHLCRALPVQNRMEQGNALPPIPFSLALEYISKKVQENQVS